MCKEQSESKHFTSLFHLLILIEPWGGKKQQQQLSTLMIPGKSA